MSRESQLERRAITDSLIELALRDGYSNVSLDAVIERSGQGAEAFARQFKDLEDCYTVLLERYRAEFLQRVLAAFAGPQTWRDQIRAVAWAMQEFFVEDYDRARMMVVELHAAGPRPQLIRDQGMDMMIELIDQGRNELDHPDSISRTTAEAVAGAIYAQIHMLVKGGRFTESASFVPRLLYTVFSPYLGNQVALAEMQRPPVPDGTALYF